INNSNHRLLTNYEDIFDPDNEFNDEIIFQFDYIYRDFPTMRNSTFQPRIQDENQEDGPLPAYFNGYNNHTVFQSVSRLYPENDLRRKSNVYNELDNGIKLKFSYL